MELNTLCEMIELYPCVTEKVLAFAAAFDFAPVMPLLRAFRNRDRMDDARRELQSRLGDDPGDVKILACMLMAGCDLHSFYRERGIDDEVYIASMKCFTRFVGETLRITGEYGFENAWWAVRQAGGHLFRIGTLEYEIVQGEDDSFISLHIPSDADFSHAACDASLAAARAFFARHFPQYSACEYRCESWLLAPELQGLLPEASNILDFQRRFDVQILGQADFDFFQFAFQTHNEDLHLLPERTSLQRNLKAFLLGGGRLSEAEGILRG